MPKPRRWIERMEVRCTDALHVWLMERVGFEEYVTIGWYDVSDTTELPFQLWLQWWRELGYTVRFRQGEAVRSRWCPVIAKCYERDYLPPLRAILEVDQTAHHKFISSVVRW